MNNETVDSEGMEMDRMPGEAAGKKKPKAGANAAVRSEIAGLLTIVAGLLLVLSLYHDGMGYAGLIFRTVLMWALGRAAWTVPLVLVGAGIVWLSSVLLKELTSRLWGVLLGSLILSAFYHGLLGPEEPFTPQVMEAGGGYIGAVISWALASAVGTIGMHIILTAGTIAAILLIANTPMTELVGAAVRGGRCRGQERVCGTGELFRIGGGWGFGAAPGAPTGARRGCHHPLLPR